MGQLEQWWSRVTHGIALFLNVQKVTGNRHCVSVLVPCKTSLRKRQITFTTMNLVQVNPETVLSVRGFVGGLQAKLRITTRWVEPVLVDMVQSEVG